MSGWQLWIEEERLVLLNSLLFFAIFVIRLSSQSGVVQPFTREDAPPPLQLCSRVFSYSSLIFFSYFFSPPLLYFLLPHSLAF